MKKLIVMLLALATVAFAIDVHFGKVQCDTLEVDSLGTIAAGSFVALTLEDLTVDSTCTINSVATFGDTVHVAGIVIGDGATMTFYDAAIGAYLQFTAAAQTAEFYGDVLCDSQLTVLDTLAVGIAAPEYFFHVSNVGDYNLFEGDATGVQYVAVDNNHATAEVGFNIWRAGVEQWSLQDSNGLFILYDADDAANRLSCDGTTGNFVIYQNLAVNGDFTAGDSAYVTDDLVVGDSLVVMAHIENTGTMNVIDAVTFGSSPDIDAMVYATGINFADASEVTGAADSIVIDFLINPPALVAGLEIKWLSEAANTGAATLTYEGTEKNIYEASDISALEANDIRSAQIVHAVYDGTQWQQISQSGN